MHRVLVLASLAYVLQGPASALASSQAPLAPMLQSVEACRAYLTGAGRSATFAGAAIFEVVSGAGGEVTQVRPVRVPASFEAFVQVAEFRGCVQRWRFSGPGTSSLSFSAGTTGEFLKSWKISISSGSRTLTVVLPLAAGR